MSSENILSNLKDIHMPPSISFWPPSFGWWVIAGLFLITIIFSYLMLWRFIKNFKPKNEALKILKEIQNEYNRNLIGPDTLKKLTKLIRRTALTFCPREEVSSLYGFEWLKFLDKSGKTNQFTNGFGTIFGNQIYEKKLKINSDPLFILVKKWISEISKKKPKIK